MNVQIPTHFENLFKPVQVIEGLQHSSTRVDSHFEPHGTISHVAYIPAPGVICQFKMGPGGLQYQRGPHVAVIPLQELVGLFERVNPHFAEPSNSLSQK